MGYFALFLVQYCRICSPREENTETMAERGSLCQESRCGGRSLWDSAVGQHNLARLQTPGGQGCGDGVRSGVMGGAEAGAAVRAGIGAARREEHAKSARMRSMVKRLQKVWREEPPRGKD